MSEGNGKPNLLDDGPLLSLGDLRKLVARKYGIDRTWNTWYSWQRRDKDDKGEYIGGVRRQDGTKVFLQATYAGGATIHSTEAAWLRFQAAQNEGRE